MKRLLLLFGVLSFLILSTPCNSSDDWLVPSERADLQKAHTQCKTWCAQNQNDCDFCSRDRGCGPGYEQKAAFGTYGFSAHSLHWYACKGSADDRINQKECEKWCDEHKGPPHNCARCTPVVGCGTDYKMLTTFRGKGKTWHACTKTAYRQASEDNKVECEKWCKEHKADGCVMCHQFPECDAFTVPMENFTGKGKNWYACKTKTSYKEESEANKAECEKWCRENKDKGCVKCDTLRYCGIGYEAMKHFEGRGKNWHACKKK
jgi:hypothetical protein